VRQHFEKFGRREGRKLRVEGSVTDLRAEKMEKIEPLLRLEMPHVRRGAKYDFLTDELRSSAAVIDTLNVSSHEYDGVALRLIEESRPASFWTAAPDCAQPIIPTSSISRSSTTTRPTCSASARRCRSETTPSTR
jgi:hypothetical protein